VALAAGYGAGHDWTRGARLLLDSLDVRVRRRAVSPPAPAARASSPASGTRPAAPARRS
jgi:hypothetical protein